MELIKGSLIQKPAHRALACASGRPQGQWLDLSLPHHQQLLRHADGSTLLEKPILVEVVRGEQVLRGRFFQCVVWIWLVFWGRPKEEWRFGDSSLQNATKLQTLLELGCLPAV